MWSLSVTRLTLFAALFGALVPSAVSAQAVSTQDAPVTTPAAAGAAPRAKAKSVKAASAKPAAVPAAPGQALQLRPFFALYEALGKPDGWKINGSLRPRFEGLGGQFRPSPVPGTNDVFTMQATLFAEYDTGPVRIGGEIFDSRAYFQRRNSNSIATTEVNALELGQAYLGFDLEDAVGAGTTSTLQVGRFTQNIGSRRLIARNQFRNTINSFTGVAYDWQNADKDQLRLFYTLPHFREPSDRAGILSNSVAFDHEGFDAQLFGGIFTKANVLGGILEAYGYGFIERDEGSQLEGIQTRDRRLFTPGFRLYRAPKAGRFDHELEAIFQTGVARNTAAITDVTDVPVKAYFVHAEAGYTFDAPWVPRISAVYDHASGDGSNPNSNNRFDTLFGARRFDYGPTSLYGPVQRANLISPGIRFEIAPDPVWDAFVAYRGLWLEDPTDSFAATGIRDRTGQSGSFAGQQIEARLRYWVVPRSIVIDTGAAYLIKGDFLRNAPNAPNTGDTIYGYLTTTFFF
ncbi:alginate export family protein [Methylobacterium sp. WL9]|uniref:alginate export family protein n=1 Tax=Methylobacterium sp. WL9 TaxID=2603898 RepID=UPI001FF03A41|nr:alginate export family protein [Methylobacterium sp. WL9]